MQDTFIKIWRTGSAFDPVRGPLDAWILLSARSLATDLLRRRSLESRKLASEPGVSEVSDEAGPERRSGAEHSLCQASLTDQTRLRAGGCRVPHRENLRKTLRKAR